MTDIVAVTSHRSIVGYALRPLIRHLGPASRLITPSANKLITSLDLSRCTQPRFVLNFRSEEGRKEAQRWYERQGRSTRFALLEYRKDKNGQFKHEFVLARLNSTTLCRFDRRARDGDRGHVLRDEGAPAEDSAHVLSSFETEYKELLEQTEVLLSIKLPAGEDLSVVLAICEGIQTHSKASAYNLMRYNCYFFSWMLIAGVARRTFNWGSDVLSKEVWEEILQTSLAHIFPSPAAKQVPPVAVLTPQRNDFMLWFKRIIAKLRRIPQATNESEPISGQSNLEDFQDALKSQYRDSYSTLLRALSSLLLRSQLGPALKKEMKYIEKSSFSATKNALAEEKVRKAVLERDTFPPILYLEFLAPGKPAITPHRNRYRYSQLKQATKTAVEMLSVGDKSWEAAWLRAWTSTPDIRQRYEWLEDKQTCVCVVPDPSEMLLKLLKQRRRWRRWRQELEHRGLELGLELGLQKLEQEQEQMLRPPSSNWSKMGESAMHMWEAMGHRALQQWKSVWDECDELSTQYGTIITVTMVGMISERLEDIVPEQLTFGDISKPEGKDIDTDNRPKDPSSLQGFIRGRMQEHFEMVDKYGFGSFQELISTAEEAIQCTQPRFVLEFRSEIGQKNVDEWYKHQGYNTRFTLLEYRKDKEGRFKHEFIVIRLNSTTVCRFDRRARDGERGYALHDEGAPAEDSAHVISSFETEYQDLLQKTEVLLSIKLPREEDLRTILAICKAIQTHPSASAYSLMRYNCYFFSWMIVAGIARRTYNWEAVLLSKESWDDLLKISLVELAPAQEPVPMPTQIQQTSRTKSWWKRIFTTKSYRQLQVNADDNFPYVLGITEMPGSLPYWCSQSHDAIKEILPKLLLRSQVGLILKKEFASVDTEATLLIRSTMAVNKVQENAIAYTIDASALDKSDPGSGLPRYVSLKLEVASSAAGKMLLTTESTKGDAWARAWKASWNSPPQKPGFRQRSINTYNAIFVEDRGAEQIQNGINAPKPIQSRPSLRLFSIADLGLSGRSWIRFARKSQKEPQVRSASDDSLEGTRDLRVMNHPYRGVAEQWETIGLRVMQEWKSAWDGCDPANAQYITTALARVTTTLLERLTDVAPEQLVFGNHFQNQAQPADSPSLQEFIRNRMHEHFEMVDRFGFGTFQELITTAEEAMCAIWVTSLEELDQQLPQSAP
ncbi:Protein Ycf2 (chloroplast) [Chloranthus spicatus] [Rhizoctonia solani]|uniref:Protein Ycf2 (Chloroplast) [Chloranthus spicatus] n=1 Tax=Rhizoctonia solani TaxID=456999 RepID=A0A0K6FLG6_9AGAM|nr:Protein Ycf2 (chloroplast) [Chloranthus spicatus] [Rhizoctonia solani]